MMSRCVRSNSWVINAQLVLEYCLPCFCICDRDWLDMNKDLFKYGIVMGAPKGVEVTISCKIACFATDSGFRTCL
jgi:hypothetical protein